jgi:glycosyltransferase involved in cell wall biosynthesis
MKLLESVALEIERSENPIPQSQSPCISVGIFAWNEEEIIGSTLSSLFAQSIFAELGRRGLVCEVLCVVNGCSDRTPDVAAKALTAQTSTHPYAHAFKWRVANLKARGKLNAWNEFVHSISAPEAELLIMMDADIQINKPHTLWNMVRALEQDREANVSVDRPRKDILHKRRKSLADRISLAMSGLTGAGQGQLCGQLYAIRSSIARNIFLPRDLLVEDGFIKAIVCTDFLTHDIQPSRIRIADEAEHVFEAYTNPKVVLKNQKRQIIAQTITHILIDQNLQGMSSAEKHRMGRVLIDRDRCDPDWLKRLIGNHLRRVGVFWRLYPGLLRQRFTQWLKLPVWKMIVYFPATLASSSVTLLAAFMAWRAMRGGTTDYWPKADRSRAAQTPGQLAAG